MTEQPAVHRMLQAALRDRSLWDQAERLGRIGTWEWDLDSRELVWSDNLFRMMGLRPGEFTPTPQRLFDRMHPGDVERVQAWLGPERAAEPGLLEYRILLGDGEVCHLQSAYVGDPGGEGRIVGFVRDVTEQRLAEREVALHQAVARALANWTSFNTGTTGLLREMAAALGLPAGALWLPDGEVLVLRVLWSAATVEQRTLERFLGALELPRGAGLAGRAWERGEPVTPSRLGADDAVLDRMAAALDGISSVVAVPAVNAGRVLAVIVLYGGERLEAGERLASALADVGRELGAFLARRPGMLRWRLTAREVEVLKLAADGLAGPEIAAALLLSSATVKTHLANAYAKIGVSGRVAAVAYALREGLIE